MLVAHWFIWSYLLNRAINIGQFKCCSVVAPKAFYWYIASLFLEMKKFLLFCICFSSCSSLPPAGGPSAGECNLFNALVFIYLPKKRFILRRGKICIESLSFSLKKIILGCFGKTLCRVKLHHSPYFWLLKATDPAWPQWIHCDTRIPTLHWLIPIRILSLCLVNIT